MTKYQEFVQVLEFISEDMFNKIIESIPSNIEIDFGDMDLDLYECNNEYYVCKEILNYAINKICPGAYAEDIDIDDKSFYIYDVNSVEELDNIVKVFDKWTISNYDRCKEDTIEWLKKKAEHQRKETIKRILENIPLEKLEKLLKDANKK